MTRVRFRSNTPPNLLAGFELGKTYEASPAPSFAESKIYFVMWCEAEAEWKLIDSALLKKAGNA